MCNFRGSNRRNQSFLAEHICYRLRFFSLEAADRFVLWPKNQVPVATTDYSGGVHQAVTGVAKEVTKVAQHFSALFRPCRDGDSQVPFTQQYIAGLLSRRPLRDGIVLAHHSLSYF